MKINKYLQTLLWPQDIKNDLLSGLWAHLWWIFVQKIRITFNIAGTSCSSIHEMHLFDVTCKDLKLDEFLQISQARRWVLIIHTLWTAAQKNACLLNQHDLDVGVGVVMGVEKIYVILHSFKIINDRVRHYIRVRAPSANKIYQRSWNVLSDNLGQVGMWNPLRSLK